MSVNCPSAGRNSGRFYWKLRSTRTVVLEKKKEWDYFIVLILCVLLGFSMKVWKDRSCLMFGAADAVETKYRMLFYEIVDNTLHHLPTCFSKTENMDFFFWPTKFWEVWCMQTEVHFSWAVCTQTGKNIWGWIRESFGEEWIIVQKLLRKILLRN